jgi:hypothetical protein
MLQSLIPGKCITIIKDMRGVAGGLLPMYQAPVFSENETKWVIVGTFFDTMNTEEPMIEQTKQVHIDEYMDVKLEADLTWTRAYVLNLISLKNLSRLVKKL